jgi:hypothetical protein
VWGGWQPLTFVNLTPGVIAPQFADACPPGGGGGGGGKGRREL